MPNLPRAAGTCTSRLLGCASGEQPLHAAAAPSESLSAVGRGYLGGLLAHARAASVFTTPTVNGYKRFSPYSLAPDRIVWGEDNKGAMVRVVGGPGDPATRLENRSGEPAANPYLYIASQIVTGLDGIDSGARPRPPDRPALRRGGRRLPASLMDAIAALRADRAFARALRGGRTSTTSSRSSRPRSQRYLAAVTDWEQREYFALY